MASPASKSSGTLRFFLPLILCVLFVLGLIGYRQHKIWSERTRVKFAIKLADKSVTTESSALLDGQRISSGDKVSIGSHLLLVTHPKAQKFQTNFFAWYGGRDFGQINLHRSSGLLNIQSAVPFSSLTIVGHDFSTNLSGVPAAVLEVPTDSYRVVATYPHWSETKTVVVTDGQTTDSIFEPRFGAVALTCNYENAIYRLQDPDQKNIDSGLIPATVTALPVGVYQLIVTIHGHELKKEVRVSLNQTNVEAAEFVFGAARIETTPPGAQVRTTSGNNLGVTPLLLTELNPQVTQFTLGLPGYELITASIEVVANQTNTLQTNLVNQAYVDAMSSAKKFMATGDFQRAMEKLKQALNSQPNDADAVYLQNDIMCRVSIQKAKALAQVGDYIGADKLLTAAQQVVPDHAEITNLLAEYTSKESAQHEQAQKDKLAVPTQVLAVALKDSLFRNEQSLFEQHELNTSKPFAELAPALIAAFESKSPTFVVRPKQSPYPDSFALSCQQEWSSGLRLVAIAGVKMNETETHILYEVMEYIPKRDVTFSGGLTVNTSYIPLHQPEAGELTEKMKAQIENGLRIANEGIQEAVRKP